jgi:hypothetical protein
VVRVQKNGICDEEGGARNWWMIMGKYVGLTWMRRGLRHYLLARSFEIAYVVMMEWLWVA